jgi:hypothetical protein
MPSAGARCPRGFSPTKPGAKNLADIVELQSAFWRKQFGVLTAQAEEVRALSTKVTADMAKPIKSQMASSADGAVKAH